MLNASTNPIQANDQILGYKLKYSIGAGGYGEVWAAEAPGGLLKAVKIIYGFHDESRAQRELKALDRIKRLRHPFLISLERIEVENGRLVIVTELADTCLREHFAEYRDRGEHGLPREKLLGYLSNVAEALDYISDEHSLQHLDIKPENLLLVGSHAKLADFGLVKSVHESQQHSMMDSLTPTYAAPELFDGRPSRTSDQYSLAVVYQELLTGIRPFSGKTTAQLASQNIGRRPNISPLPINDQAVISRALAKDPEKRYPNCRSMINDLMRRKVVAKGRPVRELGKVDRVDTSDATQDFVCTKNESTVELNGSALAAKVFGDRELEKLGTLAIDPTRNKIRPTIFIGLGQAGGKILAKIKTQIANQVQTERTTPSIKFLYIDVDRRSLYQASTQSSQANRLEGSEVLEISLRPREEYRNCKKDFSWLSRRWLFNVPRSQQTEGLRPIGRLALADHFDAVYRQINDVIESASVMEALAETGDSLGVDIDSDNPDVFIISSISGGLGSGTSLDVAQAVRTIFAEQNISNGRLFGVFLNASTRDAASQQLSTANTFAFLTEYNHFCLHGYQGDKTIDLPKFGPGAIFSAIYYLDLGKCIDDKDYDEHLHNIAQYLFLNTTSQCRAFFEQSRDESEGDASGLMVRSFGLSSASGRYGGVVNRIVRNLAQRLIEYWKQHCGLNQSSCMREVAKQLLVHSGFESSLLDRTCLNIEESNLGDQVRMRIDAVANTTVSELASHSKSRLDLAERYLDAVQRIAFGEPHGEDEHPSLMNVLEEGTKGIVSNISKQIEEHCVRLTNQPGIRIAGVSMVLSNMLLDLQKLLVSLDEGQIELVQGYRESAERFVRLFEKRNFANLSITDLEHAANENLLAVRMQVINRIKVKLTQKLITHIKKLTEVYHDLGKQLVLVNESFRETGTSNLADSVSERRTFDLVGDAIAAMIEGEFESMIQRADIQFNQRDLQEFSGLYEMIADRSAWLRELPAHISSVCQAIVTERLRRVELNELVTSADITANELKNWIDIKLGAAQPTAANCGGASRLLLALPESANHDRFVEFVAQETDYQPTIIKALLGDAVFCCEVRDIPLDSLAAAMINDNTQVKELVQRLYSRSDINWTPLSEHV